MMNLAPFLVFGLLAAGASPSVDAARAPETGQVVLTVDSLSAALLEIGAERDALRLALRAAQDEIARSRAVQDAQAGILAAAEADLSACLTAGEALKASNDVLDGLLTKERRAGKRARWMAWLKVGVPAAAAGYLAGELSP